MTAMATPLVGTQSTPLWGNLRSIQAEYTTIGGTEIEEKVREAVKAYSEEKRHRQVTEPRLSRGIELPWTGADHGHSALPDALCTDSTKPLAGPADRLLIAHGDKVGPPSGATLRISRPVAPHGKHFCQLWQVDVLYTADERQSQRKTSLVLKLYDEAWFPDPFPQAFHPWQSELFGLGLATPLAYASCEWELYARMKSYQGTLIPRSYGTHDVRKVHWQQPAPSR